MKNKISKYILSILFFLVPVSAFAALAGVSGLLTAFKDKILKPIIPITVGLAVLYFFWGTAQFILHSGDVKTRDDGKQKMIWGIIALFVMFSIYGILGFIGNTLGIPVPGLSSSNSSSLSPDFIGDPVPGSTNG